MKNPIKLFLLFLIALFVFSSPALAQKNSTPSAQPNSVLPLMQGSETVNITTPVNSDLFAGGRQVTIDTTVDGDVYVAGGQVTIKGTINQDLVVAGGEVTVSGNIKKNLIVVGGRVVIDKTAVVGGYILGGANEITLSGQTSGPARLAGGHVQLDNGSSVGGDLEVYSESSTISPDAKVAGAKRISQAPKTTDTSAPRSFLNNFGAFTFFFFLAQLLVAFLLVRIFGNSIFKLIDPTLKSPLSTLGWGLIGLIIVPIVAIILFITVVGIPLGALTLVFYALGLYFAVLIASLILGHWIYTKHWIAKDNLYLHVFVGYLLISLIGFIPFLGPLVKFVAFLIGVGAIFQWEKSLFIKKS